MSEDRDDSIEMSPGATDEEMQTLLSVLPMRLPLAWQSVLRVSNGFDAQKCLMNPAFVALGTQQLISIATAPDNWNEAYSTVKENIFPIAIDTAAGFFALDLSGVTPEGECPVVRISPDSQDEEFRKDSVAEFLEANLNEEDFQKFKPFLPNSPRQEDVNKGFVEAALRGHLKKVKELLEAGADIEAGDELGYTALIKAPLNGHKSVVRFLIEKGANVNARSNNNDLALTEAARRDYIEIVRLLLEHGADINARSWNGTALSLSIESQAYDIAYLLLERGAEPNGFNHFGWTPLRKAVSSGETELVAALLAHGADVNQKNERGETALSWARRGRDDAIIDMLLKAGAVE